MDSLASNPYAAGGIIALLIGTILAIIKMHDKTLKKIVSDHREDIKDTRAAATQQTAVVIATLQKNAVSDEKVAQSNDNLARVIEELKTQQKQNTDNLTKAFYDLLRQKT